MLHFCYFEDRTAKRDNTHTPAHTRAYTHMQILLKLLFQTSALHPDFAFSFNTCSIEVIQEKFHTHSVHVLDNFPIYYISQPTQTVSKPNFCFLVSLLLQVNSILNFLFTFSISIRVPLKLQYYSTKSVLSMI